MSGSGEGLSPSGLGNTVRFSKSEGESVDTEKADINEQLRLDRSEFSEYSPRSFERSGLLAVEPHPEIQNPIIQASDYTGIWASADFVADGQWQVLDDGYIHIFCEVSDGASDNRIGYAKSPDGLTWSDHQIVMDGSTFGSQGLPWWTTINGTHYMVPEDNTNDNLYVLTTSPSNFPTGWSKVETIDTAANYTDPIPVYHPTENRWFVFYYDEVAGDLNILYAKETGRELTGHTWSQHPSNPITSSNDIKRPAGRAIPHQDGTIQIFVQDSTRRYGDKVRALVIEELSTSSITWSRGATNPLIQGMRNGRWNDNGMHTIDPLMPYVGGRELILVDGLDASGNWSLGVYTTSSNPPADATRYRSTNQTGIASGGSGTIVSFDTLSHDARQKTGADAYFCPSPGRYWVNTTVKIGNFGTNASTPFRAELRLVVNGGFELRLDEKDIHSADRTLGGSVLRKFEDNDKLQIKLYHTAGDTVDVIADGETTRFDVDRRYTF